MKVIVHAPGTAQGKERLKQAITEEYIRTVIKTVSNLHCPKEQKQNLLETIAKEHNM